jgi:hypothetical protein
VGPGMRKFIELLRVIGNGGAQSWGGSGMLPPQCDQLSLRVSRNDAR